MAFAAQGDNGGGEEEDEVAVGHRSMRSNGDKDSDTQHKQDKKAQQHEQYEQQ